MAEAFIVFLLENLNTLISERIGALLGVNKEMERFSSLLSATTAVLEDAEEKQFTDRAIKDWLQKLSDVSYELDDVLDDCGLEAYRLQSHTCTRKVRSSLNIPFRIKIANRMKEISGRLDEIADERTKIHLRESVGEMRRTSRVGERRRTSTSIPEPRVYGRECDKEKVIGFLANDAAKCKDLSVFAIVGLGGLGKTTLAKLVFNDKWVEMHFELKMWVCVSEDFDLKRLVKEIIQSATNAACEVLEMDPLQKKLQDVLKGKRFLLVLDDIWNEDQEEWEKLRYVLACGSTGSSLVVTTRLKTVASIMATVPMHELSGLCEDDCWSLFKQRAFGRDGEERPNLVKIGKEIAKKCKGVPLAAKALGGLLFFKKEEREWLFVLHSELWNLPEEKVKILPELRLSYFHLPVEHRRCFAFCAIFPKDHEIEKQRLIHLWMANGLISSKGELEIEDVGNEIFNELCWISFMQEEKDTRNDISCFKMHDLVRDLAQSVVKEEFRLVEIGEGPSCLNLSKKVRHLTCQIMSEPTRIEIQGAQSLRTFLVLGNQYYDYSYHLKLGSLRAFDVENLQPSICITSVISDMKHLRYLNLSGSDIEVLPKSVCSLHYLLSLNLSHCTKLRKLPKQTVLLKGLRHLYIHGCYELSHLPPHIGQLTSLKTLTWFSAGRNKGCGLGELGHLNIGNYLEIKNLDEVGSSMEAKSANLPAKINLEELQLFWKARNDNESQENVEQVLEALEPSPNLSRLTIYSYKGISFPHWISSEILRNVTMIRLSDCKNCLELPPLGNLPSLRDLDISGMNCVQYFDNLRYGGRQWRCFPRLMRLWLRDLPNLESFSREDGREMFSCLSKLYIDNCPKLMLMPAGSVEDLKVSNVSELTVKSSRNLRGLTRIFLDLNHHMTCFPGGVLENLTVLKSLTIGRFTKLQEFSSDMPTVCDTLERLHISTCPDLRCLPGGMFQRSICLKSIIIALCPKLKSLGDGFAELVALEKLEIYSCDELECLPEVILRGSSRLKEISISFCQKLKSLPGDAGKLVALERLAISSCDELERLPEGIFRTSNRLKDVMIRGCKKLRSLPNGFGELMTLGVLKLEECPELEGFLTSDEQSQCETTRYVLGGFK